MRLALAAADLTGNETRYATNAIESSWISGSGAYVDRFEREFAQICGSRTAVAVSNGTVALHLALLALGAGPGDEVIVPALTYIATANAVRYVGAEPVFVDVDPATWCMSPPHVAASVTPRTKGIISVALYGHPADMDALRAIADRHGLWIVDDVAEAHFATYKSRPVGSLGTISTFSFYGNKIITCGEGGALTLDDPALEARVRLLRGQGMDPERRYYHPVIGYNFRLSNVLCAILCAQLERRATMWAYRRRVCEAYAGALAGIPGICLQPVAPWATPAPWLFSVTVGASQFGSSRDILMAALAEGDIETRPFFNPVHLMPPYQGAILGAGVRPEYSERLAASGLNLPTHHGVTSEDVARVAGLIRFTGGRGAPGRADRPTRMSSCRGACAAVDMTRRQA